MQPAQPWFAHLSLVNPHPPFATPEPFNRLYDPGAGQAPLPFLAPGESPKAPYHPVIAWMRQDAHLSDLVVKGQDKLHELSEHDFRRIKALYFSMMTEVDSQLGRLRNKLLEPDAWHDTAVVFTSDHGEMMGGSWFSG